MVIGLATMLTVVLQASFLDEEITKRVAKDHQGTAQEYRSVAYDQATKALRHTLDVVAPVANDFVAGQGDDSTSDGFADAWKSTKDLVVSRVAAITDKTKEFIGVLNSYVATTNNVDADKQAADDAQAYAESNVKKSADEAQVAAQQKAVVDNAEFAAEKSAYEAQVVDQKQAEAQQQAAAKQKAAIQAQAVAEFAAERAAYEAQVAAQKQAETKQQAANKEKASTQALAVAELRAERVAYDAHEKSLMMNKKAQETNKKSYVQSAKDTCAYINDSTFGKDFNMFPYDGAVISIVVLAGLCFGSYKIYKGGYVSKLKNRLFGKMAPQAPVVEEAPLVKAPLVKAPKRRK